MKEHIDNCITKNDNTPSVTMFKKPNYVVKLKMQPFLFYNCLLFLRRTSTKITKYTTTNICGWVCR